MTPFKNRTIDRKQPVEVYRNLHRGGYSIRQGGLVVAHSKDIVIKDCTFHIRSSAHRLFKKTGERNVHAYAKGYLGTVDDILLRFSHILYYDLERGVFHAELFGDLENCEVLYTQGDKIFVQI